MYKKDLQYYKFCLYGFFKNIKLFEPFMMLFFLEKGITFFQIGTLYAIREIGINILEIPTGAFADMLGRKRTMIFSFVAYILSFITFFIANSFFILAIAMFFYSIGDAMRTGTHKAMIFDYLRINEWLDHKVAYYGRTRSWSQLGSALSSLIAAWLVFQYGNYQIIFLLSTIPFVADLLLISSYPVVLNGPIKQSSVRLSEIYKSYLLDVKNTIKNKEIWVIWFNVATYQGLFKSAKDYLQPIILLVVASSLDLEDVSSIKNSAPIIGGVYFIIYLISSFTSRHSNITIKWFKTPEAVLNISLLMGILTFIGIGIFVNEKAHWISIILFLVIFIIQNIRKPVGTSVLAAKVDHRVLATGISIQSQIDSLAAAIFAMALGFLADKIEIGLSIGVIGLIILPLVLVFRIRS